MSRPQMRAPPLDQLGELVEIGRERLGGAPGVVDRHAWRLCVYTYIVLYIIERERERDV